MTARRPSWTGQARDALARSLRLAGEGLPRPGHDGATAVHDARKELKRSASLARLFAPLAGSAAYETLDIVNAVRRAFGRARDLDVLPAVLEDIKCDADVRAALMRAIGLERGEARGGPAQGDLEGFAAALVENAASVAEWPLEADDEALIASLRLTYKAAKRRGRDAFATGDADDLHDLRMRVVDLCHQLVPLEPAWPATFSAIGAELHRLRQDLGSHNDLTMLGEFALSRRELARGAAEAVVSEVLKRRRPLERKSQERFERVFAERPNAFMKRIGAYLLHPQARGIRGSAT